VSLIKKGMKTEKNTQNILNNSNLLPIKQYCQHLVTHKANRPLKPNGINNKFKDFPDIAENIFKALQQKKAVTIEQNKVTYNNTVIGLIIRNT